MDDEFSASGDEDPFQQYGLHHLELEHRQLFDQFFSFCRSQLSDYTFANTFIWRDCIHLRWRIMHGCMCVFANGDGGLTMLFPPMGPGNGEAALEECLEICSDYNARSNYGQLPRVEYVSTEMISLFAQGYAVVPMSGDYVYQTQRMIDLAGGDLASKRQAKNRFARRWQGRTEPYSVQKHLHGCVSLLETWQGQSQHVTVCDTSAKIKRYKEIAATGEVLLHSAALGLQGMVLFADDQLAGFTFGELMDKGQTCSILVEKTNRDFTGSAQYIFSEFCRTYWSATKWCNVGDDWEVPSLAWTKQSYRPVYRLEKFVARPCGAGQPGTTAESKLLFAVHG